jgi:LysR family transcriptional regulator for metE and metH
VAKDDRVRLTRLFRDELVGIVSARHRLANRQQIPVSALAEEPYWGAPESFARGTPLGNALEAAGVSLTRVTVLPHASGAPVEMLRANLGVTVCRRWFVAPDLARGEVVALRIGRGLWLDWSVATAGRRWLTACDGVHRRDETALSERNPRGRTPALVAQRAARIAQRTTAI